MSDSAKVGRAAAQKMVSGDIYWTQLAPEGEHLAPEGTAMTNAIDRSRDSLLRIAQVRARTGLSTATIYRREALGTFPRRQQLGPRMVAWYDSDVTAFVADPMGYRAKRPEAKD